MSLTWETLPPTLAKLGIEIDDDCVPRLRLFWRSLEEAGARTNLTRIRGEQAFLERHAVDALLGLAHLDLSPPGAWVDVGSGCGVPGLVLAIARPDRPLVLVESTGKKTEFLQRACSELELSTVSVRNERAEETGRGPLRDACAAAFTRAVGSVATCLELTLPLIAPGGLCLLYRGPSGGEQELAAGGVASLLGGGPPVEHHVELPSGDGRRLLVVQKTGPTPDTYPRRVGVPSKRPLSP